jgi:hypothetical protein
MIPHDAHTAETTGESISKCLYPADQRCHECRRKTYLYDGLREGMAPADQPGWLEAAAEAKRRLRSHSDAELSDNTNR